MEKKKRALDYWLAMTGFNSQDVWNGLVLLQYRTASSPSIVVGEAPHSQTNLERSAAELEHALWS